MSAACKFNNKLVKEVLKSKKIKFAELEKVFEITKCFNGAVPPFGSLFNIKTYIDNSLINQGDEINFNAGLRTKSVSMSISDYLKLENPEVSTFCD